VQSFAMNALSFFRVQDVHAINISAADLQQLAQSIQQLKPLMSEQGEEQNTDAGELPSEEDGSSAPDKLLDSLFVTLNGPADFTAFDLNLPRTLRAETPSLRMMDTQTQTVTLQVQEVNDALARLGAQGLPASLDGAQITVQTPAVAIAEYSNNVLIATQTPVFSGDTGVLSTLSQSLLSLPQLTDNLRLQLSDVDLTSGIVYVPVIEGFGQRTYVGNATGYLYTLSDLKTLIGSLDILPSGDGEDPLKDFGGDASALVWTRDGVLYVLAGNQPAGELVNIARSVG